MALPTVLMAIVVLVAIVGGIVAQVRSTVKASALERDVAQVQALVASGMNEAVVRALNDTAFGDGALDPLTDLPAAECVPATTTPSDPDGPLYCLDLLRRSPVDMMVGTQLASRTVVPVAIRWRLRPSDLVRSAFGWVIIDQMPDGRRTVTAYFDHAWCRDGMGGGAVCL